MNTISTYYTISIIATKSIPTYSVSIIYILYTVQVQLFYMDHSLEYDTLLRIILKYETNAMRNNFIDKVHCFQVYT